jgi:hypothetical protein
MAKTISSYYIIRKPGAPSMKLFSADEILKISVPGPISTDSKTWYESAEQSIEYLRQNTSNKEIILYAHTKSVLIHGVLALNRNLKQQAISELQHRNIPMVDDSWVIQQVLYGGGKRKMFLEPPLNSLSKTLNGGEKLIFRRDFLGWSQKKSPFEISQKLIHSLGLYFVPERNAYCRLDSNGDIEDVIRIIHKDVESKNELENDFMDVVVIKREDLNKFMALSKQCLVLRFDFTRINWENFTSWVGVQNYTRNNQDLYYHGGIQNHSSYCNGVMVVRPRVSVRELIKQWEKSENPKYKSYASFKIYDRKNGKKIETSCGPGFLSNYFQDSVLPWEISPTFFRAEVLHRFKADPEKYTLNDRSISCRNAWYLKTYDINEAGQVHTYIGYLAYLPYEEQLYWRSFNEWPKGPISKRAYQTDIKGDWFSEYDPLHDLKNTIKKLDKTSVPWWKKRGDTLLDAVRYPATDSNKEWGDELLALDQLLVEGFLVKPLRVLAEQKKCKIDSSWGSVRVLQEILIAHGCSSNTAKEMVQPLQRLHGLRSDVKGHATVEKRREAETQARGDFGSLRGHFYKLVSDCEKMFKSIILAMGIDI